MPLPPSLEVVLSIGASTVMYYLSEEDAKRRHAELLKELSQIKAKQNGGEMADTEMNGKTTSMDFLEKCDTCEILTLRKVVGSTAVAAIAGGMVFSYPAPRLITMAFGAGLGIGAAYSDCYRIFNSSG